MHLSGENYVAIRSSIRQKSFIIAEDMGIKEGDYVEIGNRCYIITSMHPINGIMGMLITEHGHLVQEYKPSALDLRLSGWKKMRAIIK